MTDRYFTQTYGATDGGAVELERLNRRNYFAWPGIKKEIKIHKPIFVPILQPERKRPEQEHAIHKALNIRSAVINYTGVSYEDFMSDNRAQIFTTARRLFIFFAQKYIPGWPLKRIGEFIGRDHTTIIYQTKMNRNAIETQEPNFLTAIGEIEKLLKQ